NQMSQRYPRLQPLTHERAAALAEDPARRRILDQIALAMSRDELDAAWSAQRAWLWKNPDDFGMLEAGERLANVEEWLASGMADSADVEQDIDPHAPVDQSRGEIPS